MRGGLLGAVKLGREWFVPENAEPTSAYGRFDWEAVDWSLSDREIAERLGASISAVWRQRKKRG